jgi:hypothetical protein
MGMFRHQRQGSLRVCYPAFVFAVTDSEKILEVNVVILHTPTQSDLYTIAPIVRTS